ncbi:glycosyl hydrolase [Aspergillus avenaceus]|uniref:Glycosyl hydrolase n=1 Tax=Aspergillus avenaceus TaxID=36643 RepID=A0A5N6TI85_ASPAV|nr:glycosyl hydrolase [Aspergillus avenaceus]
MLTKILHLLLGLWALSPVALGYTNPIRNPSGSDPFAVYSGGYYYLLTTTWNDVQVSRSTTVEGLKSAPETKVVYSTTEESHCCNVWAPEVHYLGDKWYIYYTAGTSADLDGQRLHVLAGGSTPWDDYTYAGQLTTEWAIDGSVLRFNDHGNFLMFSCFHGVEYQSICLQQLGSDYVSLTGDIYIISEPTEDFETHGTPVNEGPAALYMNGATYIAYSASYCWTSYYCVGLLTWDGTTKPTSKSAWSKHDGCLLSSANGNYGTGHNSFFQSPDSSETWIAYHATTSSSGACDDSRYTMIQKLPSGSNGVPDFGEAVAWTAEINEPSSS